MTLCIHYVYAAQNTLIYLHKDFVGVSYVLEYEYTFIT